MDEDQHSDNGSAPQTTEEAAAAAVASLAGSSAQLEAASGGVGPGTAAEGRVEAHESQQGVAKSIAGWLGWVKGLNPWKGDETAPVDKSADDMEKDGSAEAAAEERDAASAEQNQEGNKSRWSWLPWVGGGDEDESIEDIKGGPLCP